MAWEDWILAAAAVVSSSMRMARDGASSIASLRLVARSASGMEKWLRRLVRCLCLTEAAAVPHPLLQHSE